MTHQERKSKTRNQLHREEFEYAGVILATYQSMAELQQIENAAGGLENLAAEMIEFEPIRQMKRRFWEQKEKTHRNYLDEEQTIRDPIDTPVSEIYHELDILAENCYILQKYGAAESNTQGGQRRLEKARRTIPEKIEAVKDHFADIQQTLRERDNGDLLARRLYAALIHNQEKEREAIVPPEKWALPALRELYPVRKDAINRIRRSFQKGEHNYEADRVEIILSEKGWLPEEVGEVDRSSSILSEVSPSPANGSHAKSPQMSEAGQKL